MPFSKPFGSMGGRGSRAQGAGWRHAGPPGQLRKRRPTLGRCGRRNQRPLAHDQGGSRPPGTSSRPGARRSAPCSEPSSGTAFRRCKCGVEKAIKPLESAISFHRARPSCGSGEITTPLLQSLLLVCNAVGPSTSRASLPSPMKPWATGSAPRRRGRPVDELATGERPGNDA